MGGGPSSGGGGCGGERKSAVFVQRKRLVRCAVFVIALSCCVLLWVFIYLFCSSPTSSSAVIHLVCLSRCCRHSAFICAWRMKCFCRVTAHIVLVILKIFFFYHYHYTYFSLKKLHCLAVLIPCQNLNQLFCVSFLWLRHCVCLFFQLRLALL